MTYLGSLFFNFLVVFFVDRVIPGVEVTLYEGVPNIGADLFFALAVGFLNATIFPLMAVLELRVTRWKIALATFLISFSSFGVISAVSFGVEVVNFSGFFFGGLIVWVTACLTNYLEWQHYLAKK